MLHDPYNFDFLTMTEGFKEKELKKALIDNIIRFLISKVYEFVHNLECARRHFAAISERNVVFDVVKDYRSLYDVVAK